MLHALVMAGGSGTRFWPASRRQCPKQLLRLYGEQTMLQATVDRFTGLISPNRVLVLTNRDLVPAVAEQLPQLSTESIVGEPVKRDTAPCIGLAAAILQRRDPEAVMLVTPADHVITQRDRFQQAVQQAADLVTRDSKQLVTFGIPPTYPAESFGYIERGDPLKDAGSCSVYQVKMFREKPSIEVAESYVAAGTFYWNAGIFVWRAATILEALRRFEPDMAEHVERIASRAGTPEFEDVFREEFSQINGKSIDYAVMERYDHVLTMEAPFDWNDVGNWRSLARMTEPDEHGNVIHGKHLGMLTQNCIVRSDNEHLIVTLGIEDLIVVHTADATLIAHQRDEEKVRQIVAELQQRGWDEYL